jgi:WD40 repeat protein/Tfp pilus assembly protein PilF
MLEMLRLIREQEPTRPSTRLSTADGLPALAANRGTVPVKLKKLVRGELDWIVMKALEKDRNRRYETANSFAMDVQRYLADEPVLACPPSAGYRFRKFARRNKGGLAMVAVVAGAALVLIAGTLLHNARLGVALQDAQTNLEKARLAEDQARCAEQEKTRQLAIAHLREAQAWRNSGLVGRRFKSLEALRKATEQFRALGELDEERTLELRNEAIACLALADLKPGKEWAQNPGWSGPSGFDPTLQHYVVCSTAADHPGKPDVRQGQVSIRRAADDREIARLPGFGAPVVWTQFSPNGRYLAAHYEQGQCHNYVWDLSRREAILKVSQGDYGTVPSFSPDSRLVALSRPDHSIRIYELPSGATWKDLPPGLEAESVHFHPDGRRLAVVSRRIVQLRDLSDGKELATFRHPGWVSALAWRSDGKVFATGCTDHAIYLWDTVNPAQPLRILKGHVEAVDHLGFSHGGDLLLSAGSDSTIRLWDPMTGQQLVKMPGGSYCQFGPDDQGLDHGWQVATGRECRTFHGSKVLHRVAISAGGRLMASAGDNCVKLWDLAATREGDKELAILPAGWNARAHFDPKGESLITDGIEGPQRWPITPDRKTGGLVIGPPQSLGLSARAPLHFWGDWDCSDFALSADGRTVAHCPQRGQALVFDLENPRRKLLIESPHLIYPAFSPDGRWLATGSWWGRGVKVWNVQTGKPAHDFDLGGPEETAAWPAFSPDGKWLVTGTFAEYRFWEVGGSWQPRHSLPRKNAGKTSGWIVFSPDGKMLAVRHSMTEVRLVNPATSTEFARLPTAGSPYCFSPDGSQLVTSAGRDGSFQVWDLRLIRQQLKAIGLDWDLPPYPPPPSAPPPLPQGVGQRGPLRVKVLAAEPLPPSKELDAQAHLERGLLYAQLREYQRAWADFNRASELDPTRPPWKEVVRAYSQAIERNPKDASAYHERAEAHERLGQWEQAIIDHSQAFKLAPHRLSILVWRGLAYLRTGQEDRAAEDFRKTGALETDEANRLARKLATSPDPWHRELNVAIDLARQATRQAPGKATYWNTLGVAHYRAGNWKESLAALQKSMDLGKGGDSFDWFFLATAHWQLGNKDEARKWYDRAVAWMEKSQHVNEELRRFRAQAAQLIGRRKQKD